MKHEEHEIQKAIIDWRDMQAIGNPIRLLYAIPNGGARGVLEAVRLKREGVLAGMPDLCLPVPNRLFSALYIEVKTAKGRVSPEQSERFEELLEVGNEVTVVRTAQKAIEVIQNYLADK